MVKIKGVFIYSDYPSKVLSIEGMIDSLGDYNLSVENRGNFFEFFDLGELEFRDLGKKIAGLKVRDTSAPLNEISETDSTEVGSEIQRIKGKERSLGDFYDGLWLQRIFHKVMTRKVPGEFGSGFVHLVFTSRLFGTFEIERYHARVVLTGLPSLISTSGVVEAPARPREYYWLKAGLIQGGKDIGELDLLYKGRFIEYDDSRITRILKSYALQPIFYEITGNPFCDNPSCCLYNSHWQEEVLKAQFRGALCEEHRDIILG